MPRWHVSDLGDTWYGPDDHRSHFCQKPVYSREWKCRRILFAQGPVRSTEAQNTPRFDGSFDSQEAPINQRQWRYESVTHDGEADTSPRRVSGFLRHTPTSNQLSRRNAAPAGISRQEPVNQFIQLRTHEKRRYVDIEIFANAA